MPESETSKAGPLGYCPPVLFWIAEFTDGSVLCQFDPTTGRETLFKTVDQTRLRSFGWYPVSRKLADLVKTVQLRVNPLLHIYKMNLGPGQSLIAHKQPKIHTVTAHVCLQCHYLWQFRDKPGELNYPYSDMKVEMHAHCDNPCPPNLHTKDGQHRYVTPQCPKCGAYTRLVCENCKISRSKYATADPAIFEYRCAQCQGHLPDQTRAIQWEERHTDYFLGYGRDGERFILKISENGDVEA